MITTCTVCQARYQLEDDKIPRRVIRVRCPACSGVFSLDGTVLPEQTAFDAAPLDGLESGYGAPAAAPAPPAPAPAAPAAEFDHGFAQPEPARAAAPTALAEPEPQVEPEPAAPVRAGGPRRRRSKEEMLARALVSDILVYNRDQRDNALRDGTLVEALGAEIKKSWELYKEKVGADVANNTNHFREALNEILAVGQKVF